MGIISDLKTKFQRKPSFSSATNDQKPNSKKYWVQLQRRTDAGTWENVEDEKPSGVYRTIKFENGLYTISDPGVL